MLRRLVQTSVNRLGSVNRMHRGPGSVLNQAFRYWHVIAPYLTARKAANLLRCHAEMGLRRTHVRSTPYILRMESTNACNLSCPGCATGIKVNPTPKGFVDVAKYARVLDAVAPHLLLTRLDGLGEPLLHPKIVELIHMAHERRSATAISSHFGEKTLPPGRAGELVDSGLDYLIVSIDGPDQQSYEKYRVGGKLEVVCRNVRALVEARRARRSGTPLIEVQFLGTDQNRHLADRMPALVESLGADRLRWKMVHPDALKIRLAKDFAGHPCFFQYTTWSIGWSGARKLCVNAWGDTEPMEEVFGHEEDLMGRANNEPYLVALRRFLAGDRDLAEMDPIIGDPRSRTLSYRVPRGRDMSRCLNCATTGLVVDRTKEWLEDYICT